MAKQQEMLEKKRREKAEYNTATTRADIKKARKEERARARQKPDNPLFQRRKSKLEYKEMVFKEKEKAAKASNPNLKKAMVAEEEGYVPVSQWFLSICWIKIPIVGFIYALFLALYKKTPYDKKNFARGYLLYRLLVLLLAFTVLYVLYKIGLDFVDQLLSMVS